MPAAPAPLQHELRRLDLAAGERAGVDQAGGGDDGGAVLVVVEHRDVEQLVQLCSMMKHSGALMSSRLMPPKVLPMILTQ